jgi:hypothetical protein
LVLLPARTTVGDAVFDSSAPKLRAIDRSGRSRTSRPSSFWFDISRISGRTSAGCCASSTPRKSCT